MNRVPEPELMDDPAQALAYASADFAAVNQGFADRFLAAFPRLVAGDLVDLGCGPADIPARIATARPALRCIGIDGAVAMLRHARGSVVHAVAARLGELPLRDGRFDAVVSNSLLHHLPDPTLFWREVRRLSRPGAAILVMDLHRPESPAAARAIVEAYAGSEPEILRRDFFASLLAAFTLDEVREQIRGAGLDLETELTSDRHWVAVAR